MSSLHDVLRQAVQKHSGRTLLRIDDTCWTAAHISKLVDAVAAELCQHGLTKGDHVWLLLPNSIDFVVAIMAISKCGAVAVPLNPLSGPVEIERYAAVAPPRFILLDSNQARLEMQASLAAWDVRKAGLAAMSSNIFLVAVDQNATGTARQSDPDIALTLFTSGTTGKAKGVPLTANGLLQSAYDSCQSLQFTAEDEILCPLPMFHVFGLVVGLLASWHAGASVRLAPRFIPGDVLGHMLGEATVFVAVPAMATALLAAADQTDADVRLHRIRLAATGGAPLESALAQRFNDRFGIMPLQGYGMTETSGIISLPRPGQTGRGCGWPVASIELEVRARETFADARDGRGEIWIRGPQVIRSYLGQSSTADQFDAEGWFNTGDIGVVDPSGEVVLVGRSKDLILRGGMNVYPQEIESVLLQHPAIASAAVVGRPDPDLGEEVVAFVIARNKVDPNEIVKFVRDRVALYKYPREVHLVESLPITPAGKIQRHLLPKH
jgi:long-chain acyl-CoA synthetase